MIKSIVNILIIIKQARLKKAESYIQNKTMRIESELIRAELEALRAILDQLK